MYLVHLRRKREKNDSTLHASSEPVIEKPCENRSDVSIFYVETQSGNEHSSSDNENIDVHVDGQPNNDVELPQEPWHVPSSSQQSKPRSSRSTPKTKK